MARVVKKIDKPKTTSITNAQEFGKVIQYKRTSLNLTIKQVADFSQLNERTISNIEKGNERVNLGNALKVAHLLGVTISFEE